MKSWTQQKERHRFGEKIKNFMKKFYYYYKYELDVMNEEDGDLKKKVSFLSLK